MLTGRLQGETYKSGKNFNAWLEKGRIAKIHWGKKGQMKRKGKKQKEKMVDRNLIKSTPLWESMVAGFES